MTVSAAVLAHRRATNERSRKIKLGTWRGMVDAKPAREHVKELRRVWHASYEAIAETAGVSVGALRHLAEGTRRRGLPPPARITPVVADAILTVTVDDLPDACRINPIGATRRLRALAVEGWSLAEISTRGCVQIAGLKKLRAGEKPQITVDLNRRIRIVYEDLIDTDPVAAGMRRFSVTDIRNRARKNGWLPAAAWADAIDDPAVKPWEAVRCSHPACPRGSRDDRLLCRYHLKLLRRRGTLEGLRALRNSKDLIEDAQFILTTEPPMRPGTEEIDGHLLAERLGTTWSTLDQALRRANTSLDKLRESA